ncbi:hypothetical protein EMGR_007971 [Emarellia grisea]
MFSFLVVAELACQSLVSNDTSAAILAGANIILNPERLVDGGQSVQDGSPSGHFLSRGRQASRYGKGEDVNAVFLKRLDHALRDGDPIRAIIRAGLRITMDEGLHQCAQVRILRLPVSVPHMRWQISKILRQPLISSVMEWIQREANGPKMRTALIKSFPEAARRIKPLDNVLQSLRNRSRWSLLHELTHARDPEVVRRPEFSEPLSAALELAILAVMENHSVRPHWVVEHSSGEIAAAYVAGFLTLEDAIKVAYFRGQAAQGACDTVKERMGMTPEAHEKERPTNVTLAGVLSALEEVQARLRQDDHACRMLQVDIPYHSKFVAATAEAFEQFTLQERPLVQELGCSGGVTNAVDRHWQPIGGPDLQQLILESQLGVSSFIPSRNGSYPPS